MAVTFTVTPVKTHVLGDRKEVIADVACTGTPSAGGDNLTAAALGCDLELNSVHPIGNALDATNANALGVSVDHSPIAAFALVKVVFHVQAVAGAGTAAVAYTGATAGYKFRVRVVGKGKGL